MNLNRLLAPAVLALVPLLSAATEGTSAATAPQGASALAASTALEPISLIRNGAELKVTSFSELSSAAPARTHWIVRGVQADQPGRMRLTLVSLDEASTLVVGVPEKSTKERNVLDGDTVQLEPTGLGGIALRHNGKPLAIMLDLDAGRVPSGFPL